MSHCGWSAMLLVRVCACDVGLQCVVGAAGFRAAWLSNPQQAHVFAAPLICFLACISARGATLWFSAFALSVYRQLPGGICSRLLKPLHSRPSLFMCTFQANLVLSQRSAYATDDPTFTYLCCHQLLLHCQALPNCTLEVVQASLG